MIWREYLVIEPAVTWLVRWFKVEIKNAHMANFISTSLLIDWGGSDLLRTMVVREEDSNVCAYCHDAIAFSVTWPI